MSTNAKPPSLASIQPFQPFSNSNGNGFHNDFYEKSEDLTEEAQRFVRLRGLPYSASETSVREWFAGVNIKDIHLTAASDGRPSGEAYLELPTKEDVGEALKKDRASMGSRYIEVFPISGDELHQFFKRLEVKRSTSDKGFIRVRGLPYNCRRDDLTDFFKGLTVEEIVFGKEPGYPGDRPSGECYVKFGTKDEANRALLQNGQHMGHRYLEIFEIDGEAFSLFKDKMTHVGGPPCGPVPLGSLPPGPRFPSPWMDAGFGPPMPPPPPQGFGYDYPPEPPFEPERGSRRHGRGAGGGRGGRGRQVPGGNGPAPLRAFRAEPPPQFSRRYNPYGREESFGPRGSAPYGGGPPNAAWHSPGPHGGANGQYPPDAFGAYGEYAPPPPPPMPLSYNENVGPTKIYMRGLPFRVTSRQIEDFFAPLVCVDVRAGVLEDGRASGDGIVEFVSPPDADAALRKDRNTIGNRYVELFPTLTVKIPSNTRYQRVGGQGSSIPPLGGIGPSPYDAMGGMGLAPRPPLPQMSSMGPQMPGQYHPPPPPSATGYHW